MISPDQEINNNIKSVKLFMVLWKLISSKKLKLNNIKLKYRFSLIFIEFYKNFEFINNIKIF